LITGQNIPASGLDQNMVYDNSHVISSDDVGQYEDAQLNTSGNQHSVYNDIQDIGLRHQEPGSSSVLENNDASKYEDIKGYDLVKTNQILYEGLSDQVSFID